MGSCISSSTTSAAVAAAPAAKVVALDGSLHEYPRLVTVSAVLGPMRKSCFLCSADSLYLDKHIPALAPDFVLEHDQIYFVMPNAKLGYPLPGSDMAALAIKAGAALARDSEKKKKMVVMDRRVKGRPTVAPFVCNTDCVEPGDIVVKSSIVKRPRAKGRVAYRSRNRVKLDTIEETEEQG